MSESELVDETLEKLRALKATKARRQIDAYKPYPRQVEFHTLGRTKSQRLFKAGNQCGKTRCGASEMAFHLTGVYPDDWKGRRYNRPVLAWACGETQEQVRDTIQRLLLGDIGQIGTGAVPGDLVLAHPPAAGGVSGAVGLVQVRHRTGGISLLVFKNYGQKREAWQGPTIDIVWCDEEPPEDLWTEALMRLKGDGIAWLTFTSFKGKSKVVSGFFGDRRTEDKAVITMTLHEAEHFTEEQKALRISRIPEHERPSRVMGELMMGEGAVFPIEPKEITVPGFQTPRHWPVLGALDIGWDHPTAAVKLAWNRDIDCVHVTEEYRKNKAVPAIHIAAIKPWGEVMPWAWPHDAAAADKGSGKPISHQYRKGGLRMLPAHATFPDGSNSVEAGILDMQERMQTGRLKVHAHLWQWFEEFNGYHRKDGKIVKEEDDLMAATRYGIMMLRFAQIPQAMMNLQTDTMHAYDPFQPQEYNHFGAR